MGLDNASLQLLLNISVILLMEQIKLGWFVQFQDVLVYDAIINTTFKSQNQVTFMSMLDSLRYYETGSCG